VRSARPSDILQSSGSLRWFIGKQHAHQTAFPVLLPGSGRALSRRKTCIGAPDGAETLRRWSLLFSPPTIVVGGSQSRARGAMMAFREAAAHGIGRIGEQG